MENTLVCMSDIGGEHGSVGGEETLNNNNQRTMEEPNPSNQIIKKDLP